jgi:hypothetical protein
MELSMKPESPLTDLTHEELVDLLDEQYFVLASTASDALGAVLWDISQGSFLEHHGLSDERMMMALLTLAKRLAPAWYVPAMDYYKQVGSK